MNQNQYDQDYNAGLREMVTRGDRHYYGTLPDGKKDATRRKPRDMAKSDLAKDVGYQAFLEKVAAALSHLRRVDLQDKKSPHNHHVREYINVQWTTGGVSGGSCWETSNPQPYSSNYKEEDLSELDIILTAFCPNITFLQFRDLSKNCVEYYTYSENEYYGNCTDYSGKVCFLYNLYEYLHKHSFIATV